MRPLIRRRVAWAAAAAGIAGVIGVAKLAFLGLTAWIGQPFGMLNDLALALLVLAIAPVMLGCYELGGVTPLWPARLSLASGVSAAVVYAALQLAFVARLVTFDYTHPATGPLLVQCVALVVVGLWLTGAPPLAGPWLPGPLRWLGAAGGLGAVLIGVGLIAAGLGHPVTQVGGLAFDLLFPVWALLLARVLSSRVPPPAG